MRHPDHISIKKHRRQLWTQILLPIFAAAIVFILAIVLLSLATFRTNGDVDRWAAISTMWLVMPVMILSFFLIIILGAMIYALRRVAQLIPSYSYQAQRFVTRIEGGVKHMAGIAQKPALLFREFGAFVKAVIKKARERI